MIAAILLVGMALSCAVDAYGCDKCERQERPTVETEKRPKSARKAVCFRTNPREKLR